MHDSDVVDDLLKQIDAPIAQFSADGAYDKRKVYGLLAARAIGPTIPPQNGAALWEAGHPRNALIQAIRHRGWRDWVRASGYGLRALVENAIYRLKRLTGATLSARLPETQTAEVHVRIAILNTMTHLDMPISTPNPSAL